MKALTYIGIFIFLLGYSIVRGQDIHFSQFYNSPLTLNPANTGLFDGDYRFAGNYRNQWNAVTVPFATLSLTGDLANSFGIKGLGLGAVFSHDNTGDSKFTTTVVNVSGSYVLSFATDKTLSFGVQTGFTNKTLSFDELKFDAQYNGLSFQQGLPNRENFAANRQTFFNFHSGVRYAQKIANRKHFSIGLGLFNITKPKESYFNNEAIEMDRRFVADATYQFNVTSTIDLIPSMFLMAQGTYFEYIAGARGKYVLSDLVGAKQAAYIGLFFRTKDAGFITAEYDYNNWHFGLSYDINLSTLRQASKGRGGIEFSAIYILKHLKKSAEKFKKCPDYL